MTSQARRYAPALAAAILVLVGANALYTVKPSQQALVLRLGVPTRVVNQGPSGEAAGLYVKWPGLDEVVRLDRRLIALKGEPQVITTKDGQRLAVQAALTYRILDPLTFYRATDGESRGGDRLQALLDARLAGRLQAASWDDIVSQRRAALSQSVLSDVRQAASADGLGVQIADVRLIHANPPPAEAQGVARRMQDAEAEQAAYIRLQGDAHKRELIADADREAADIRGDGEQRALEVRGQGDAERAAILGAAYDADPDFARFFRRLEAYDQALNPANTTLVLSADNAFISLFGHGPGATPKR